MVAWYPEQGFMIAFAINNHFGWRVPLWTSLEKILIGDETDLPPRPATGTTPDMSGSYRLGEGSLVTLETKAPWILVTAQDETAARILGFEGGAIKAGASLPTRLVAGGNLVGVHLRPGSPDLTWTEIEVVETSSEDSALPRLAVPAQPKASGCAPLARFDAHLMKRRHSVVLHNMREDTTYHFRFRTRGQNGVEGESPDFTIRTLKGLQPTHPFTDDRIHISMQMASVNDGSNVTVRMYLGAPADDATVGVLDNPATARPFSWSDSVMMGNLQVTIP